MQPLTIWMMFGILNFGAIVPPTLITAHVNIFRLGPICAFLKIAFPTILHALGLLQFAVYCGLPFSVVFFSWFQHLNILCTDISEILVLEEQTGIHLRCIKRRITTLNNSFD
jgi:hypothetical protein